jgi:hypothetical protein
VALAWPASCAWTVVRATQWPLTAAQLRTLRPHTGHGLIALSAADADVLSDDAAMTVIGSGTSLEGDRWVLGRDVSDGSSYTYLAVETPNGHHSKGGYGSPPLPPGWRLNTCLQHDDVGPDQIILSLAGDVAGVTVTLSDGRRDRLTLYSDPTHTGVRLAALVYPRDLDIHRIDLVNASGEPLPDRL